MNINTKVFPDLDMMIPDNYTLLKTGIYLNGLTLLNQLCFHLNRYRILKRLLQVSLKTLPNLLYLSNLNSHILKALVHNLLPTPVKVSPK